MFQKNHIILVWCRERDSHAHNKLITFKLGISIFRSIKVNLLLNNEYVLALTILLRLSNLSSWNRSFRNAPIIYHIVEKHDDQARKIG